MDHRVVGRGWGFPECCIEQYAREHEADANYYSSLYRGAKLLTREDGSTGRYVPCDACLLVDEPDRPWESFEDSYLACTGRPLPDHYRRLQEAS